MVLAALVLGVSACGSGNGLSAQQAADRLRAANPDMTSDQAGCVADRLLVRFGSDGLGPKLESTIPDPDFQEVEFTDMFRCGVGGDPRQQIIDQLEANDLPDTTAPCVADRLLATMSDADIGALLSGDVNQPLTVKFDTAMSDCGSPVASSASAGTVPDLPPSTSTPAPTASVPPTS